MVPIRAWQQCSRALLALPVRRFHLVVPRASSCDIGGSPYIILNFRAEFSRPNHPRLAWPSSDDEVAGEGELQGSCVTSLARDLTGPAAPQNEASMPVTEEDEENKINQSQSSTNHHILANSHPHLGLGNHLQRSDSLRSERSENSFSSASENKRVSFNADVKVKRIPNKNKGQKPTSETRSEPEPVTFAKVDRQPPPVDPKAVEAETSQILAQLQGIECSVSNVPSVDKQPQQQQHPLLKKANSYTALFSKKLNGNLSNSNSSINNVSNSATNLNRLVFKFMERFFVSFISHLATSLGEFDLCPLFSHFLHIQIFGFTPGELGS